MMDKDLINTYAYGNLHKVLLKELFATLFHLQEQAELNRNPDSAVLGEAPRPTRKVLLDALRGKVERTIWETSFPPQQPKADEIRQAEMLYVRQFFEELADLLPEPNQPNLPDSE